MSETKRCARCKTDKPLTDFKWPHSSWCRPCQREYVATRRADPKYCAQRIKERDGSVVAQRLRRLRVLDHYGHACACCHVTDKEFLTVDHINNDGKEHRKAIKDLNINQWLVRHNFPEGFQLLCYNCNLAKGRYGYCPHDKPNAQARGLARPAWHPGRPRMISTPASITP